jgi:hypothetical protein
VGRVIGDTSGSGYFTLYNYALSSMTVSHTPTNSSTGKDGQAIPLPSAINGTPPNAYGWDTDVWTIAPGYGPYPVFQWQVAAGILP